jgi:hypothetical protein
MPGIKGCHQCRICRRWLEGEANRLPSSDEAERGELIRQMEQGCCDGCIPQAKALGVWRE